MWVVTVNDKYFLRSLNIKCVKGKMLTKDDFEVTNDINQAYLFNTELSCLDMIVLLTYLHLVNYEFRMIEVKDLTLQLKIPLFVIRLGNKYLGDYKIVKNHHINAKIKQQIKDNLIFVDNIKDALIVDYMRASALAVFLSDLCCYDILSMIYLVNVGNEIIKE